MAYPGDRTQADAHLLIDNEHGDQQQQRPQQAGAVVLASLGIGRDAAGVVVADHDDQAGPHDGQQREQPRTPRPAWREVVLAHGAKCAANVAHMGAVENRGPTSGSPRDLRVAWGRHVARGNYTVEGIDLGGHWSVPCGVLRPRTLAKATRSGQASSSRSVRAGWIDSDRREQLWGNRRRVAEGS